MSEQKETMWIDVLKPFINDNEDMLKLRANIKAERVKHNVLPESSKTFEIFRLLSLEKTKVVIVGQDPYPSRKHANGIGFSSDSSERPESLANIFKEIYNSLYIGQKYEDCFQSNNLKPWVDQGVLLINANMSVVEGKPGSHKEIGWEPFIAKVLEIADKLPSNPIFVFMGSRAEELVKYISSYPDTICFSTGHPSPRTADKYFFGNGIFKAINDELMRRFFKDLFPDIFDCIDFEKMVLSTRSFMDSRGYEGISRETIGKNAEMYAEGFPRFMTDQFSSVRSKIEINWRT